MLYKLTLPGFGVSTCCLVVVMVCLFLGSSDAQYRFRVDSSDVVSNRILDATDMQLKNDTLEIFSTSKVFAYPFGEFDEIQEIKKALPELSIKTRVVSLYGDSSNKVFTFQISSGKSFIKFLKEPPGDEASSTFEVFFGKIEDSVFTLPGGVKVGVSKEDAIERYFEVMPVPLIKSINVIRIETVLGPTYYLEFEEGVLKDVCLKTDGYEPADAIEY